MEPGPHLDLIEADRHRIGQVIDGRVFLGFVAVDAARIVIADPEVSARAGEIAMEQWFAEDKHTQIDERAEFRTTGVIAEAEIGDGLYPVFAYVNEETGRPYRVVIELGREWSCLTYGDPKRRPHIVVPPSESA